MVWPSASAATVGIVTPSPRSASRSAPASTVGALLAVTVKSASPKAEPTVARIFVVPAPTPVARPVDELTVATAVFAELQTTVVPVGWLATVAVNCCVWPAIFVAVVGLTVTVTAGGGPDGSSSQLAATATSRGRRARRAVRSIPGGRAERIVIGATNGGNERSRAACLGDRRSGSK